MIILRSAASSPKNVGRAIYQRIGSSIMHGERHISYHLFSTDSSMKSKHKRLFLDDWARCWTVEGTGKLKNVFGYGDSIGVCLASRFKSIPTPLSISQDWFNFSLGLFSTGNHDLSYNLSCPTLTHPSQTQQLRHNLLSAFNYSFQFDHSARYAFLSTTQLGALFPDLRFIHQEFDVRYDIPLGFYGAALNFGISGGIVFPWPWGSGALNDTFFMGGNTCPVSDDSGIDLALDLSFDLPWKLLRDAAGIHAHIFASTGCLNKLSEFSTQKLRDSFRSSVGFGVILPAQLFRMKVYGKIRFNSTFWISTNAGCYITRSSNSFCFS